MNISAQENSPFSRYGIGDLYPNQTIGARALGGMTAAFSDGQSINSDNPATYASIKVATYDLGISIDSRTLLDNSLSEKYNSTNFSPAYFMLGFPLDKKHGMGFAFGIKPISRINYNVQNFSLANFNNQEDSVSNLYTGTGGLNQGFFGFGKKFKFDSNRVNISLGFNTGWNFGKKEINTTTNIVSDTVQYNASNTEVYTPFWGMFLNGGMQADIQLASKKNKNTNIISVYTLRLGGDYSFQQNLHANQTNTDATVYGNANGQMVPYDTVFNKENILGRVFIPSSYTSGIMFIKTVISGPYGFDKWMIGGEYDAGNWANYRFYGTPDATVNNWTARFGGEYVPDPVFGKSFWSRSIYRLGFYTGKNYTNADGNGLKETAVTFGTGFHLKARRSYDNEYTLLNTAFEIGKRGTGVNNITENYFKFSVGLSLSDIWFQKRKYD